MLLQPQVFEQSLFLLCSVKGDKPLFDFDSPAQFSIGTGGVLYVSKEYFTGE